MASSIGYRVPVLVLDLFSTGLSLLRSFAKKGVPVYGIDHNPSRIGFKSRHGLKFICPDPVQKSCECIQFIQDLVDRRGQKMVAIPTSDSFALLLDRYRNELKDYLYFAIPNYCLKDRLISKRGLMESAKQFGVPVSESVLVRSADELNHCIDSLPYPCVMKPNFSFDWHTGPVQSITKGNKVIVVKSAEECMKVYAKISCFSNEIQIQEIIPGPDENLVYFVSYTDRNHRVRVSFAGRKKRVSPIHFGSASYAEIFRDPLLTEMCIGLLEGCKFWGCSGIELKKDERDGIYKLIEINARFGLWDAVGDRLGTDTALACYRDLLGLDIQDAHNQIAGLKWIKFSEDVRSFVRYRSEAILNFSQWLQSLRGQKVWDDICWDDPVPTIDSLLNIPGGLVRSAIRRFKKR
jgi:D-aspartate ligase